VKRPINRYELERAIERGKVHELLQKALGEDEDTSIPEPTADFYNTLKSAHSDHPIFKDPVASRNLYNMLLDAQSAKETSPAENAALTQTRAKGQKFPRSDKVPPKGLAGQAAGQNDSDMEYLQDQEGADKWNASRKL
jgi:hypothetical protein